jgi:hypothetical protein
LALVLVVACSSLPERADFTPADKEYVFTVADVDTLAPACLKVKPNRYGEDQTFIKSLSKVNGFGITYGQRFECTGEEAEVRVVASVQTSAERAKQLYNSDVSRRLHAQHRRSTPPGDYGADDLYLSIGQDEFYVSLRRGRINYTVAIDGFSLPENVVKPIVLAKVAYLEANPQLYSAARR